MFKTLALHHLNCSREWAFFGFHSTSEIQFFWRWNISPSSLLAECKMSTKRQDTPLTIRFENEGRHVWFSTVHVTWWSRDWPAENWCIVTWRDMWGNFYFPLRCDRFISFQNFLTILIAINWMMSQSGDRLKQLEEIEKVSSPLSFIYLLITVRAIILKYTSITPHMHAHNIKLKR